MKAICEVSVKKNEAALQARHYHCRFFESFLCSKTCLALAEFGKVILIEKFNNHRYVFANYFTRRFFSTNHCFILHCENSLLIWHNSKYLPNARVRCSCDNRRYCACYILHRLVHYASASLYIFLQLLGHLFCISSCVLQLCLSHALFRCTDYKNPLTKLQTGRDVE